MNILWSSYILFSVYEDSIVFPSSSSITLFSSFISKFFHVKIITTPSSCDDPSMFVTFKIDVDNFYKYHLNITISFINIPCFRYTTRYLYMLKGLILKNGILLCFIMKNLLVWWYQE